MKERASEREQARERKRRKKIDEGLNNLCVVCIQYYVCRTIIIVCVTEQTSR